VSPGSTGYIHTGISYYRTVSKSNTTTFIVNKSRYVWISVNGRCSFTHVLTKPQESVVCRHT